MRHLDVQYCFIQQLYWDKRRTIHKIPGLENPADVLTKYVQPQVLKNLLTSTGMCCVDKVERQVSCVVSVRILRRKDPWRPGDLCK